MPMQSQGGPCNKGNLLKDLTFPVDQVPGTKIKLKQFKRQPGTKKSKFKSDYKQAKKPKQH